MKCPVCGYRGSREFCTIHRQVGDKNLEANFQHCQNCRSLFKAGATVDYVDGEPEQVTIKVPFWPPRGVRIGLFKAWRHCDPAKVHVYPSLPGLVSLLGARGYTYTGHEYTEDKGRDNRQISNKEFLIARFRRDGGQETV